MEDKIVDINPDQDNMEDKIVDINPDQDNKELKLAVYGTVLTAIELTKINNAFLRYTKKRQEMLEKQDELQQIITEMMHELGFTQSEFESIITSKWLDMVVIQKASIVTKEPIPKIINPQTGQLTIGVDEDGRISPIQTRGGVIGKES